MLAVKSYDGYACRETLAACMGLLSECYAPDARWNLSQVTITRAHLIPARNHCMEVAMEARRALGVDVLLSVDADVGWLRPRDVFTLMEECLDFGDVALAAAVARRGDGDGLNVFPPETEGSLRPLTTAKTVERVGFDLVAFHLAWWARAFADRDGQREVLEEQVTRDATNCFRWLPPLGEDYDACDFVRAMHGRVVICPWVATVHQGRVWAGERPMVERPS